MNYVTRWARIVNIVARSLPGVIAAVLVFLSAVTPDVLQLIGDLEADTGVELSWLTHWITEWSARVVAWLTLAGQVVKRVTPVPEALQGVGPMRVVVTEAHAEGPDGP